MRSGNYAEPVFRLKEAAAFVLDVKTEEQIRRCFSRLSFDCLDIHKGDVRAAMQKYKHVQAPSLLIVDISNSELPLSDIQDLANVCSPDVRVLVVGTSDNVGLYRNLLSNGVSDYLLKPLPSDLLYRTLAKLQMNEESTISPAKTGKAVGIYGASGGVGATSILGNVADLLSRKLYRRVMLVDLNLQKGDIRLLLGHDAGKGLAELLVSPERQDGFFIDRVAQSVGPRLDVLCSETDWTIASDILPQSIASLANHLRRHYHFVLFDIAGFDVQRTLQILEGMDVRLIVMPPTLAALRNSKRVLDNLNAQPSDRQNIVILNASRPVFKSDIAIKKIEDFLGQAVEFQIPYDGRNFSAAALNGIPVCRRRGKATTQMKKISQLLVGQDGRRPGDRHGMY